VGDTNGERNKAMNCTVSGCPGEYEQRRINQTYRVSGELMVVSDIPVEQCTVCGDILLTAETARKIEKLVQNHGPANQSAPVYSMTG